MKNYSFLKVVSAISIAILGLSLAAQVSFDVPIGSGIPITGQSFAILMIGYFLDWRLSFVSVFIYLILGVIGVPLFAEGKSGIDVITGLSGGYLVGFLPAVVLVAKWEYAKRNDLLHTFQTFVFSTGIILIIGIMRLSLDLGFQRAIAIGLKPFWVGSIIKVLLALIVIYLYLRYNYKEKEG
jgi:biotin transport system substrate-specific component